MQVRTIGKLRLWARQPDGSYKELPTLIVRMVKRQVNTLLIPAEMYDTWRLSSQPTYWWSRTLQLSLPRVHRALDPSEATQSVLAQQAQQESFKHVLVCAQEDSCPFWGTDVGRRDRRVR